MSDIEKIEQEKGISLEDAKFWAGMPTEECLKPEDRPDYWEGRNWEYSPDLYNGFGEE